MRASTVYNVARRTPLQKAETLSRTLGHHVFVKREDRQSVHSFKIRGAYQRMSSLTPQGVRNGVIAASAGNHAQGVARAASVLQIHATVVVPETTPQIKQDAIRNLGADLVVFGDSYDDAYHHALVLAQEQGKEFVHPYDHPETIVGQGTVGLEIHDQAPDLDAVFVPVGGGGLVSGIALALKTLRPKTKIIGVESEEADAMAQSLRQNQRVLLPHIGGFVDGCSVKQVGAETFRIAQSLLDDVIVVTNDEVCSAVKALFEDLRAVAEPAGALGLAGLARYTQTAPPNQNFATILSGANLNFDRLQYIVERAALGRRTETILAITIPEKPGSFARLCRAIGKRNLTEFNYRFVSDRQATVFAGISVTDQADADNLKQTLSDQGFVYADLSQDETAKLHLRHLVGGRHADPTPERVFRVDFPERPGALATFLEQLGDRWNISLFHYRNHGSDRGRALVAFQVPPGSNHDFDAFTRVQPFPMTEETGSQAVSLFLTQEESYV